MAVMPVQSLDARWIGWTVILVGLAAGWYAYRGAAARRSGANSR